MALFNLTDIKFKKDQERGPLNPIVSSKYQTNILKYPVDIGTSYDKGHYMVIHINEQENTAQDFNNFRRGESFGTKPTVIAISEEIERLRGATNVPQQIGGVVKKFTSNTALGFSSLLPSQEQIDRLESDAKKLGDSLKNINGFRRIKRTTDSIALYMPDTLGFTNNQGYSDVSVFDQLGIIGTGAAGVSSLVDNNQSPNGVTNGTAFGLQAIRDITSGRLSFGAGLALAAVGLASNPGLELLYTSPSFRSFRFSFMFYPRSSAEAKQVISIIRKFQFHQAPEILSRAGGRFLVPPSEFDIEFFYNGKENPNIPKISTCVLDTVDVDYAPNGFAAYEIPGENDPSRGGTGMPIAIRMDLQFKETQIVTKEFLAITDQLADEKDYTKDYTAASQRGEFGTS